VRDLIMSADDDEPVEYLVADELQKFFPTLCLGELAAAVEEVAQAEVLEGGGIGGSGSIKRDGARASAIF
jgi:hypothetical protein